MQVQMANALSKITTTVNIDNELSYIEDKFKLNNGKCSLLKVNNLILKVTIGINDEVPVFIVEQNGKVVITCAIIINNYHKQRLIANAIENDFDKEKLLFYNNLNNNSIVFHSLLEVENIALIILYILNSL